MPSSSPSKNTTKKRAHIYACMRQTENWSKMSAEHKFDNSKFSEANVRQAIHEASPKMEQMLKIIQQVDANDMATHGQLFKHFIFSDVKEQGYGAKILASGLMAAGYKNLIVKNKSSLALTTTAKDGKSNSFGLLSSSPIYGMEFTQKLKKELLQTYNKRPDNVQGQLIRFIILDSGFKEGIDLFDVKYVHIFEPSMTIADLKQTIGRATRTCGQKGLPFEPEVGWPLFVYNYYIAVPPEVQDTYIATNRMLLSDPDKARLFKGAPKLRDAILLYSELDTALLNLSEQLYKIAPILSVDFELTNNIHHLDDMEFLYDTYAKSGSLTSPMKSMSPGNLQRTVEGGGVKLRDFTSIKCDGQCGERSTHDIPASVDFLKAVYAAHGHDLKELPTSRMPGNMRLYFCTYMKEHPEFCQQVNDEWSKRAAQVPLAIEQKIESPARKTLSLRKTVSLQKTPSPVVQRTLSLPLQLTELSPTRHITLRKSPSVQKVAESIKQTLDILPIVDIAAPPVKTDYAILEYEGVATPALKQPEPGPPPKRLNFTAMRDYIKTNFASGFTWPVMEIENKCGPPPSRGGAKETKRGISTDLDKIITLNPTQDFVAHFFTPASPYKGLLLFHSVGTGKTCTAIATATASFDREGYTILWVTRTTLKSDIWKNMFGQICHSIIADEVRKGLTLPEDEARRKRLLSKNWIEPMSYKQFSNLLSGQNEFYHKLKERNGASDVIKRTLIIIDEAHKLYGNDLQVLERPDMNIMEELLQNSYKMSGADSARLLIMSATPFTNSPMEMFSLINLCKEDDKIITDPSKFKELYMGKDNMLTEKGVKKLADAVSGYISYINREHDATQFAQPVMIEVPVIMSHLTGEDAAIRPYLSGDGKEVTAQARMLRDEMKEIKDRFKVTLKQKLSECKKNKMEGGRSTSMSMSTSSKSTSPAHVKLIKAQMKELKKQFKKKLTRKLLECDSLSSGKTKCSRKIKHDITREQKYTMAKLKLALPHRAKSGSTRKITGHSQCSRAIKQQVAAEEERALQPVKDELAQLQSMKARVTSVNEGLLQEVMLMHRCKNIKPMLKL